MEKKSVLVTGGAGFIGTHTTVELVEAGYDVVVVDDLSNSDMSGIEGVRKITGVDVPLVVVDCCDKESLKNEVFEHYKELEAIGLAAPQVTYITHACSRSYEVLQEQPALVYECSQPYERVQVLQYGIFVICNGLWRCKLTSCNREDRA